MAGKFNAMVFADIYPMYVKKAEHKGRTKQEIDTVIFWLTGYDSNGLQEQLDKRVNFEEFFNGTPKFNPNANKITGTVCGCRVENITDPIEQKVRYLDKLVDELAKNKPLEKVLRTDYENF
jgi:hypothetical protein